MMGIFELFKKKENPHSNIPKIKAEKQAKYDFDTLEGIKSIPMPQYHRFIEGSTPAENIEYILQRKATEHKHNGRMDLAIACLRKSNEIMPYSNLNWLAEDYLRLVEYLKDAGEFNEARNVESELKKSLPLVFDETVKALELLNKTLDSAKQLQTDLVEMSFHGSTCSECSKYQGRVFSISGKDSRFPKLPDQVFKYGGIHEGCRHSFHPFIYGLSELSNGKKDPIAFSNRPFKDNRKPEEREEYNRMVGEAKQREIDKNEFDSLRENLPDKAPKSFGGYRKMKNSKSKSYLSLKETALIAGIHIE